MMRALRGRSELGVAALLAAVGVVVAVDASGLNAGTAQVGPVGPKVVPLLVCGLLLVCAVLLAFDVLRGGRGELEGGEDVDLGQASDWRTVLLLVAAFVANIALIDRAGWVISGTVLFWGSVYALGSRHYVRDGIIAVVLSLTTFYAFYVGLGMARPAGILQGVL
jgi:putative tricarboxylic transport membrane protein